MQVYGVDRVDNNRLREMISAINNKIIKAIQTEIKRNI